MGSKIHKVVTKRSEIFGDKQINIVKPVNKGQGKSNFIKIDIEKGVFILISTSTTQSCTNRLASFCFINLINDALVHLSVEIIKKPI